MSEKEYAVRRTKNAPKPSSAMLPRSLHVK
jgi:hypothetical protein